MIMIRSHQIMVIRSKHTFTMKLRRQDTLMGWQKSICFSKVS